ncbi:MAG TPA: M48 family metalloprotease [Dehalococcoidia bacterium]|nr:M48 family metalloprotease [Dehalococcoidia bacterium]
MTQQRVLIWDRIDANRRSSRLLVLAFAAVLLPVVAYLAMYLMVWVAMALGLIAVGFGLADAVSGDSGFAVFAAVDAALSVLILLAVAYLLFRFASAIVLRLAGARPVTQAEEPDLWRTVENLCIGAGLRQPRLYVVESGAANAFATGLDPARASLVVTRGLMDLLDRRELEGVVAHELAQIANYDTRLGTLLAVGVALLRLPLGIVIAIFRFLFRIHWAVGWGLLLYLGLPMLATIPFGLSLVDDMFAEDTLLGVLFVFSMLLPFYVFLGAPAIAYLLRTAVLRQHEYLADADAALLTRYPEGLARALAKMGGAGSEGLRVGAATAHLYVVDPLPSDSMLWDRIFSAQPPLDQRIAAVAAMGGGVPPSVIREAEEAGARFRSAPPPAVAAPAGAPAATNGRPDPVEATPTRTAAAATTFRLTGASTLYGTPDAASPPVGQLASGSLITVLEGAGDFLRVLTSDDRFAYLRRMASMEAVEQPAVAESAFTDPEVEVLVEPDDRRGG